MNKEKIDGFLLKHKKWLNDETDGRRLDLSYVNLGDADLRDADLRNARLMGTNLRGANLRDADLSYVNLKGANLSYVNLMGTNLRGANLIDANLMGANLIDAELRGANLMGANLIDAELRSANLMGANLIDAELRSAKIFYPIACPEKGSFIGFKKANGYIIELEITEDSLRSSATNRKCRCSEAKVISITNIDGTSCDVKSVASVYDNSFIYTVGSIVKVDNFDTNRWNECAPGIHFFITREEAVRY